MNCKTFRQDHPFRYLENDIGKIRFKPKADSEDYLDKKQNFHGHNYII
jgi:hypothetical protein